MPGIEKRGKYCHKRIKNPKYFDKRSFRTKNLNKTTKIVIGCKKGHYKRGICKIGTETQKVLKIAKRNKCPSFFGW